MIIETFITHCLNALPDATRVALVLQIRFHSTDVRVKGELMMLKGVLGMN